MQLYGDYHTHTVYSRKKHGKNTIHENVAWAKVKGLKEIAITDHGYGHMLYGAKRRKVDKVKKEIEESKLFNEINVLYGIEANFTSLDGDLDLRDGDYEKLDILLAGFHSFAKPKTFKDWIKLFLANIFAGKNSVEKLRVRNTETVLNAMNRYPIDILTHLGAGFPVDIKPIALLAKKKGTYIELNGRRCVFTDEEMKFMIENGNKFIINSDAHSSLKVGDCLQPLNFVIKYNIPEKQIVNMDKLPKFTKVSRKN